MASRREEQRPEIVVPEGLARPTVVEDWCAFDDIERDARRDGYTTVGQFVFLAEIHAYGQHQRAAQEWLRGHPDLRQIAGPTLRPEWRDEGAFVAQAEAWLRHVRPTITHHAVCTILDYERGRVDGD